MDQEMDTLCRQQTHSTTYIHTLPTMQGEAFPQLANPLHQTQ